MSLFLISIIINVILIFELVCKYYEIDKLRYELNITQISYFSQLNHIIIGRTQRDADGEVVRATVVRLE